MDAIFRPKYTAGHLWRLFEPVVGFAVPFLGYLGQLDLSRRIALTAHIPVERPGISAVVCFALFGWLALCRVLSFLSQDCLRRIEINDDRLILYRVLGKKIEVDYDRLKWNGEYLRVNKLHSFPAARMQNRDALKELLAKHVDTHADDRPEEVAENLRELGKKLTNWHDIFVLLGILVLVAIILSFYYLSKVQVTGKMFLIIDCALGIGAVAYIVSIVRHLLLSTSITEN